MKDAAFVGRFSLKGGSFFHSEFLDINISGYDLNEVCLIKSISFSRLRKCHCEMSNGCWDNWVLVNNRSSVISATIIYIAIKLSRLHSHICKEVNSILFMKIRPFSLHFENVSRLYFIVIAMPTFCLSINVLIMFSFQILQILSIYEFCIRQYSAQC